MKKTILLLVSLPLGLLLFAQKAEYHSKCNVSVTDVSRIATFGYLVGYSVQFKNNSREAADGVYWIAKFYDNKDKLIDRKEESFNSTNLADPIQSGATKTIARSPNIKGASKVVIEISEVHFVSKGTCR